MVCKNEAIDMLMRDIIKNKKLLAVLDLIENKLKQEFNDSRIVATPANEKETPIAALGGQRTDMCFAIMKM